MSTSDAAQIIVAASDSSATDKARADYVATGNADDVVIQRALDALPATGGTVVLLPGHYSIAQTISPNSYDTLEAYGAVLQPDLTLLKADVASHIANLVNINKPGSNHISLIGFTVDGKNNALNVDGNPIAGICLSDLNVGAKYITAKDLTVQHVSDEGIYNETYNDGNPDHQAANFDIENCWANYDASFFGEGGFAPGADGVTVVGGGAIGNGSSNHAAAGFAFAGGKQLYMTDFTAKNNDNTGIELLKDSNNNLYSLDCSVDAIVYDDQAVPTQTRDFLDASDSATNVFTNDNFGTGVTTAVADFLIYDQNTGDLQIGKRTDTGNTHFIDGGILGAQYQFKGTGAFLGDGRDGFLIYVPSSGELDVKETNGGFTQTANVGIVGAGLQFKGTGDFLGAGSAQFLLIDSGGNLFIEEPNANGVTQTTTLGNIGSLSVEGTGDFLGEGHAQVLLSDSSGNLTIDEYAGGLQTTSAGSVSTAFQFVGTGDYLGDDRAQFLLYNPSTGEMDIGERTNAAAQPQLTNIGSLGAQWQFVGSGDFLGDGHAQFLIQNQNTGEIDIGERKSTGYTHFTSLGTLGSQWQFEGTGHFLGNSG